MNTASPITAYCGIICSDCSAYIATQSKDLAQLRRVAEQWQVEYNQVNVTIQDVMCDGCLDDNGAKGAHCAECNIRACGQERGVTNCAYCPEYACNKLEALFSFVPDLRQTLNAIRHDLPDFATQ